MSNEPQPSSGDDVVLIAAAELFKTLSTPLRLAIVAELAKGPRRVQDLVEVTQASQPLVSQHLRLMRTARLVTGTRHGREVVYALADEHVAHIVLDAMHHVAEDRPEHIVTD